MILTNKQKKAKNPDQLQTLRLLTVHTSVAGLLLCCCAASYDPVHVPVLLWHCSFKSKTEWSGRFL